MRDYKNYNSSWCINYKGGFIQGAYFDNVEVIRVMVDAFAYSIEVKSLHAAKIMISKHLKKIN